ncbi:Conserved_hypothetical protein [Hexamita inflata]|uniref:Uncharacterized protein n=1 Tax=Hexamita inflata TaxID=28002 RepID=A0AA86NT39_9EUKA|nr:Conserved hypothetical protein [Hexamita inflata]
MSSQPNSASSIRGLQSDEYMQLQKISVLNPVISKVYQHYFVQQDLIVKDPKEILVMVREPPFQYNIDNRAYQPSVMPGFLRAVDFSQGVCTVDLCTNQIPDSERQGKRRKKVDQFNWLRVIVPIRRISLLHSLKAKPLSNFNLITRNQPSSRNLNSPAMSARITARSNNSQMFKSSDKLVITKESVKTELEDQYKNICELKFQDMQDQHARAALCNQISQDWQADESMVCVDVDQLKTFELRTKHREAICQKLSKALFLNDIVISYRAHFQDYVGGILSQVYEMFLSSQSIQPVILQMFDDMDELLTQILRAEKTLKSKQPIKQQFDVQSVSKLLQTWRKTNSYPDFVPNFNQDIRYSQEPQLIQQLFCLKFQLIPLYESLVSLLIQYELNGRKCGFIARVWSAELNHEFYQTNLNEFADMIRKFDIYEVDQFQAGRITNQQQLDALLQKLFLQSKKQYTFLKPLQFQVEQNLAINNNKIEFQADYKPDCIWISEAIFKIFSLFNVQSSVIAIDDKNVCDSKDYVVGQQNPQEYTTMNDIEHKIYIGAQLDQKQLQIHLQYSVTHADQYIILLKNLFSFQDFDKKIQSYLLFDQNLSKVTSLLNTKQLPKDQLIFLTEELDNLVLFKDLSQLVMDLSDLMPILYSLDSAEQYTKSIAKIKLQNCYFSSDLVDQYEQIFEQINKVYISAQSTFENVVNQIQTRLLSEVTHLRSVIAFGQTAPKYFEIVLQIQNKISTQGAKIIKQLVQIQETNQAQVFNAFKGKANQLDSIFNADDLIFKFVKLFKECQNIQFITDRNPQLIFKILENLDSWLQNCSEHLMNIIQQLLEVDVVDIDDMKNNPLKFLDKFPLLSQNILIPRIQFQIPLEQHEQALIFMQSIQKACAFQLQAIGLDISQSLKSFVYNNLSLETPLGQNYQLLEMYTRADYNNYSSVDAPAFSLIKILAELKFILQQFITIEQNILWFKIEIQKHSKINFFEKINEYLSFFELNRIITPLFEITQTREAIYKTHSTYVLYNVEQYPSKELFDGCERISRCIMLIRKRQEDGFNVRSNKYHLIIKKLIHNQEYKTITIQYANWLDYVLFIEDSVLKLIPSISMMYLLQSGKAEEFEQILKVKQPVLKIQTSQILEALEQDNTIFDKLITVWAAAQVDKQAEQQLNKIISIVQNIIVENVFGNNCFQKPMQKENIIDHIKQGMNEGLDVQHYYEQYENIKTIECNSIQNVLVLPAYTETLCSESQNYVSLILNNIGFKGKFSFECETLVDENLSYINDILREKVKYAAVQKQYSPNIEQKCRDIENIVQVLKMIYNCLKRIPNLIHDLMLAYYNGNPVKIIGQAAKISVLSTLEKIQLLDCQDRWTKLMQQFMISSSRTRLFDLALNHDFCQKITQINQTIHTIHKNQKRQNYGWIITTMSSPFDTEIMKFNEEMSISSHFSYDDHGQTIKQLKKIVPSVSFKQYPLATLIPASMQIRFAVYTLQYNPLKNWPPVKYEIFQNLTEVIMDQKIGKITGVSSDDEKLMFDVPIDVPDSLIYVFDYIANESGHQLKQSIKSFYDLFYIQLKKYSLQREGQDAIYFADCNENTKYEDLPPYFKVFDEFIKNTVLAVQTSVISTYVAMIYQQVYAKGITGKLQKEDFKFVYFLLNDLSVLCGVFPNKTPIWKKSLLCKIQEWQEIFSYSMPLLLSMHNSKIIAENLHFSYQTYDQNSDSIIITDSRQTFQIQTGNHWTGASTIFDSQLKLNTKQQAIITKILQAVSQNRTVFMLGFIAKQYFNIDYIMICKALSRMLCRRLMIIFVTESSFGQNLIKISASIAAGYIVLLIGVEFLPESQILELVSLSQSIYQQKGKLQGLVVAHDIHEEILVHQKHCNIQSSASKLQIQLVNANIEDFDSSGYLIIFMPSLKTIQTSIQFSFSQTSSGQQDKTPNKPTQNKNEKGKPNILDNYQEFYQSDYELNRIPKSFKNSTLINIETEAPLDIFKSISAEYGRPFYEINTFLRSMSNGMARLGLFDIKTILNRAKEHTDNTAVAMMTFDYLIRQSINIVIESDMESLSILLANFVCTSFSLDKSNSNIIIQASRSYYQIIKSLALQNGIQKQSQVDQTQIQKVSFSTYISEYIQRQINPQLMHFTQLFSQLHQLPIECIYDVLFAQDLLKDQKPLLLVSSNYNYLNIFTSILSSRTQTILKRIYASEQLLNELKEPSQKLIVICPANISDLLKMLDKIFGFFLQFPIIQDENGQPVHILDSKAIPMVTICLTTNQFIQLQKEKISLIFEHKMILFPFIEGSDGMRKILVSGINIKANNFFTNNIIKNMQIGKGIQFDLNSEAIQTIIQTFRQKMLFSKQQHLDTQQSTNKIELLNSFTLAVITILFTKLIKIFGIGKSVEEVFLIKSMFYFNLYQFKVIEPQKRQINNEFVDISYDQINNLLVDDTKRQVLLTKMLNFDHQSIGYDQMTRKTAVLNATMQFYTQMAINKAKGKAFDPSEFFKKIDFTRMISEALTLNRFHVCDIHSPFCESTGFLKDDMKEIEDRAKKESVTQKMQKIVHDIKVSQYNQPNKNVGTGSFGSLLYNFNQNFILNAFLKPNKIENGLENLVQPFICAMWNAVSLYYTTITNNTKQQLLTKKSGSKIISQKYTQFIEELQNLNDIPPHVLQNIHSIKEPQQILLKLFKQKLPDYQNDSAFSYLNYFGALNTDSTSRQYDTFVSQITFDQYQIGKGLLQNITTETDQEICEKTIVQACKQALDARRQHLDEMHGSQIKYQAGQTKEQENELYEQIAQISEKKVQKEKKQALNIDNPYNSDSENSNQHEKSNEEIQTVQSLEKEIKLVEQLQLDIENICLDQDLMKQLSVSRLNDKHLHFDSQRCAQVVTIACAMQSPITFAVVGNNFSGKSTLINVAKLLVRDTVQCGYLLLNETSSYSVSNSVRKVICDNYLTRNYQLASQQRYDQTNKQPLTSMDQIVRNGRVLDYFQTLCFPSYHFHCSNSVDDQISSYLTLLLRDHVVKFDGTNEDGDLSVQIDNQFQASIGSSVISDTSFIVECSKDSKILELCSIQIDVPQLSEQFLYELVDKYHKNIQWSKQFVQGMMQIKQILPQSLQENFQVINQIVLNQNFTMPSNANTDKVIELIQYYETLGYQFEERVIDSTAFNILKTSSDDALKEFNVHTYLNALKRSDLETEQITEQLASLCMLNKIKVGQSQKGFSPTPWSDCQLVNDKKFQIRPAWQSYIINLGIQNAKRTIQHIESESFSNTFGDVIKSVMNINEPSTQGTHFNAISKNLELQLLIAIGSKQINPFWVLHFAELYRLCGQKLDPNNAIKVFECFSQLQTTQFNNLCQLANLSNLGIIEEQQNTLSGFISLDDKALVRLSLECECVDKAGLYQNEIDSYSQIIREDDKLKKKYQNKVREFLGFPLITSLTLVPAKVVVNMNQIANHQLNAFIETYSDFCSSKIMFTVPKVKAEAEIVIDEDTKYKKWTVNDVQELSPQYLQFNNKYVGQQKYIVDVQKILKLLNGQDKNYVDEYKIIEYLIKMTNQLQKLNYNEDDIRYVQVMMILRAAVALALGINPQLIFPQNQDDQWSEFGYILGINVRSNMQSYFPSKIVKTGRNMMQLPYICCSYSDLEYRMNSYSTEHVSKQVEDHKNSLKKLRSLQIHQMQSNPDLQIDQKLQILAETLSQSNMIQEFIMQRINITIICPSSLLELKSKYGVKLDVLLSRLLQPNNVLPTIFDPEEMQVIASISAYQLNGQNTFDQKNITTLLSGTLSLIILNDAPNCEMILPPQIDQFGTVNTAANDFLLDCPDKYKEILQQESKIRLVQNQGTNILNQVKRATNKIQNGFDTYLYERVQKSALNSVIVSSREVFALFKMSDCQTPKEIQLPADITVDWTLFKNQFIISCWMVYKILSKYSITPVVTISRFSQISTQICQLILKKTELFMNHTTMIQTIQKLYKNLAEPVKAPIQKVDTDTFTSEFIESNVLSLLQSQLQQIQKQKGNLPSEKTINLQTAAGESVYLRNYFYSTEQLMSDEQRTSVLVVMKHQTQNQLKIHQ